MPSTLEFFTITLEIQHTGEDGSYFFVITMVNYTCVWLYISDCLYHNAQLRIWNHVFGGMIYSLDRENRDKDTMTECGKVGESHIEGRTRYTDAMEQRTWLLL